MALLIIICMILIIVFIVLFITYWTQRKNIFYPAVGASTPNIRTGRAIYLINAERLEHNLPPYLGVEFTPPLTYGFTFYANPNPNAIWLWLEQKQQCGVLNTWPFYDCSANYYNEKAKGADRYQCGYCGGGSLSDPGFIFCSYCKKGGDSSPYTSIQLVSNADPSGNTVINYYNNVWQVGSLDPTESLRFLWTEVDQAANIQTQYGLSIRIKSLPAETTGAPIVPLSYLTSQILPDGTIAGTPTGESDNSIFFVSFVPIKHA